MNPTHVTVQMESPEVFKRLIVGTSSVLLQQQQQKAHMPLGNVLPEILKFA